MNTFTYMLLTSAQRLARNYKASLILLLSFYVGLILPAFCLSNTRYYQVQTDKQHFSEYQNTTHVSFMGQLYGEEELGKFMQAVGTDTAQFYARNWDIIWEFGNGNATLCGIGGQYKSFEGIHVVQGRSFTQMELSENNSICMVAQALLDENGYRVGDTVTIQGEAFEIIGSMDDSRYTGYILLPFVKMKQIYMDAELQLTIDFQTADVEKGLMDAEDYLRAENPDVDIVLLQQYQANAKEVQLMVKDMIFGRAIFGVCAYVFSAVNIAMFVLQRMYESKKRYAIQEVHGMSLGQLFWENILENMLLVFTSNLLMLLTIGPLGKLFGLQNEMAIDIHMLFPLLALSMGLCFFLSSVLIFQYKKLSVNNILIQEG